MSVSINGTTGLVFNDGSTQPTAASGFGFKNRIINGDMRIDQRNAGASFTVGNLGYGVDRWLTQAVSVSVTGQQVTGSTGNNKALRITGASGNTVVQVSQRIESVNIYDCASQTATVSFTLYGSTSGSVSVRFIYPTATDNYTAVTEPVAGTTVNFTTTPTQYSVTRTLDSNANKGVWVLLDFGAVGAGVTRTLEFFQLEKGSTATSFDYRPYGTELALCQRYFETGSVWREGTNAGAGAQCVFTETFKVVKRGNATFTFGNVNGANANITSISGPEAMYEWISPFNQTNLTTGFAFRFVPSSTTSTMRQYWTASSEL